jgi:hypothetical protein
MKKLLLVLLALGCLATLAPAAHAATLFVATGSNGINGQLYTIDSTTAVATLVGPILIGGSPVGLTALAFHPVTGVLYGLTTNDGPSPNRSLVTINPATGAAVLIGSIGANAAGDMAFNSSGVLFAWLKSGNLVTINLTTGASTVVGPAGAPFVNGGAVSFVGGVLYAAVGGSDGPLYTVNTSTGAATAGPTLTGAPIDGGMAAMTTSGSGVLYAVDSDMSSSPTTSRLVTINTTTGAVTQVAALDLPGDTDALAFAVTLAPAAVVPTLSTLGILALGLVLAAVGFLLVSRR